MAAGTIALTNNSTAVAGTGTSFTTELKTGDFVYANVGGAPFTLVVAAISSDTQLTVAVAFDGPTAAGLSWNAVPASIQVAITQKILNDFASVARGRILDFQNWQKIYSDAQSVTVVRPDRTQFTGPSWGYMATQFANKANLVNDVVEVTHGGTGQKTLSGVMTWLGLGDAAFKNTGTASGTLAAGNDGRFANFTVSQSPKNIVVSNSFRWDVPAGLICHGGANSASRNSVFTVDWTSAGGTHIFIDSTDMGQVQFITSDERLKTKIQPATSGFIERVKSQEVVEYEWIDKKMRGSNRLRGFIAQRVGKIDPMLMNGSEEGQYGLEIIGLLADAYGAIQEQQSFIESQTAELEELKARMKAIDGLDA
jgi:hypothetical protein